MEYRAAHHQNPQLRFDHEDWRPEYAIFNRVGLLPYPMQENRNMHDHLNPVVNSFLQQIMQTRSFTSLMNANKQVVFERSRAIYQTKCVGCGGNGHNVGHGCPSLKRIKAIGTKWPAAKTVINQAFT